MKTQDREANVKIQGGEVITKFAWLLTGIGIGAAAGLLFAPQSGEDSREWISTKCKDGVDTVNGKLRTKTKQVADWIDESQNQVTDAVTAGREAFNKAKAGAS